MAVVVGGAVFGGRHGKVYASWPMMLLDIGDHGVCVRTRWRWVNIAFRWGASGTTKVPVPDDEPWQSSWAALSRIDYCSTKVVFVPQVGPVCLFRPGYPWRVGRVVAAATAKGIPLRRVWFMSTITNRENFRLS